MAPMPRPRKPYVQREVSRHGHVVWYFRRGDGPRARLSGEYESPEWLRDYERALGVTAGAPTKPKSARNTFSWLLQRYLDSVAFARLAPATQMQRRQILGRVAATGGDVHIENIDRKMIAEGRDRRSATPTAAMNFVKIMSALFTWAVEAGLMDANPAAEVEHKAIKTDGRHTWTVEEVQRFQAVHPLGSMPRLAMDVMLFTGMRPSDAIRFGRQHIRDGVIRYRSQKTHIDVELPLLPPLAQSIARSPTGDLMFLTTAYRATQGIAKRQPFASTNSFGAWFKKQCEAAGVPGRAHGLRKAGATLAAEHGASDLELMALWGWLTPQQAALYTRKANRGKLANAAGQKLMKAHSENILSPHLPKSIPAPTEIES